MPELKKYALTLNVGVRFKSFLKSYLRLSTFLYVLESRHIAVTCVIM